MKTEYKHIHFIQIGRKIRTTIWECRTKLDGVLGEVKWYGPWRQYTFFPAAYTVFSASCMVDINDFMQTLRATEKASADAPKDSD